MEIIFSCSSAGEFECQGALFGSKARTGVRAEAGLTSESREGGREGGGGEGTVGPGQSGLVVAAGKQTDRQTDRRWR